ncbi:hypothetical protein [Acinetobacter sp. ANC 3813]|uniref:hypothetical protein n=1 Tax=Acinetobacter sp. ANC 3813 TaxID=1977873 RepID=UPI000A33AD5F|nr:hypothetical protein [Acinetobacter sp. ANC 3813]OTG87867.1 hypothetical protein B9T34_16150 [Acinetobacter sp. ANC 3813]
MRLRTRGHDLENERELRALGESHGAIHMFFINGHFCHFYKKGDADSKHSWLFMPIKDQKCLEWKISYNLALEPVVKFYSNLGYDAVLMPIKLENGE